MLITSFRLLYSRNALMWVGILLPPAAVKGEVSCRTIVLFGTKSREHPAAYDFRESFQRKGLYFHPLWLLGIPQNNVLRLLQWPKRTIKSFKHLQRRMTVRLCLSTAMMPSRTNSHQHLIKVAYFPKQVFYLEKSCCFDLYGNWKLMLISNSFLMCLKVSKWWNICIYIREDTSMALLWVHPSILLRIAGDHFERKKWVCCHISHDISQNTFQILIDTIISKCPQTQVVL